MSQLMYTSMSHSVCEILSELWSFVHGRVHWSICVRLEKWSVAVQPSLIPRLPPFLFFSCVHTEEGGKAWEHLSRDMTWGGHREGPDYKYMRNKPDSKFLTSQVEYLWMSRLVTEGSMVKSSTLFEFGPSTSTWRHSCDKCSRRAIPKYFSKLYCC